jgi:hypothetical protein
VAPWSGLMAPSMRDGGETINETGRGESCMLAEISMKATGRIISLMDLASSLDKMERDMKETGKSTISTEKALLPGLMVVVTRVTS